VEENMTRPLLLLLLAPLVAGCDAASDPFPANAPDAAAYAFAVSPVRSTDLVIVPLFVQDAGGNPIDPATTGAATPLYEVRAGAPVLAPDGSHVTWGGWSAATGRLSVRCNPLGTHTVLQLDGLIPQGVYTIWNVTFAAPGFEPSFSNLIGVGAAGPADGSRNVLRASRSGQGSISVISPGGPLSVFGSLATCAPTDEFEWHVVGLYHIDGQSHGPELGPDGTMAEQFAFVFRNEP
jgi:hypothetical protein